MASPPTSASILVVDDNAIMRKMVRLTLESEGHVVHEAADGRSALEAMGQHRPDLVLQDLLLPDMDGFDLVRELRRLPGGADLPILAFSGFQSKLEQSRGLQAGFSDHLFKPVEPSQLVQTVEAHLPRKKDAGQNSGPRVLVADDDPVQLKLLKLHLEHLGYQVDAVADGGAALVHAREYPPDAILSDVLMPHLDGFRLSLALRQEPSLADVPIVLMSAAYTEDVDRRLARSAGANALVQHTPDLEEVTEALRAQLAGHIVPASGMRPELPLEDYTHRVIRQLERQVGLNFNLSRRLSTLEARFSVLATLAKSLADSSAAETVLDEMLAGALDAFAISKGLAYLLMPDGSLELRSQLGYGDTQQPPLASFFGHSDMLLDLLRGGKPEVLSTAGEPSLDAQEVLAAAGATAILVAPLVLFHQPLGVLVTISNKELGSDWTSFADALGAQVGQAIGLAQALEKLKMSEERYRGIVETANEAIMLVDQDERLTFVNQKACEMLGYSAGELIGHSMLEFLADDQQASAAHRRARRRQGARELYESHLRRKDGSDLWALTSSSPVLDAKGAYAGSLGLHTDVTDRKRAEEALAHQALHDSLTSLPNRTLLHEHLQQAILTARRDKKGLALAMLDLDRFKEINDAFGHHYGDLLLRQLGARLQATLRKSDTVARLGGDEFAVILPSAKSKADAELAAAKILRALRDRFQLDDEVAAEVGASVGLVFYPDHGDDADTLLRRADVAMYVAKGQRGGFAWYSPEQDEHTATRVMLISELRHAIEGGELELYYQPKVAFKTRRLLAVESLVRWRHPRRGLMTPENFVPLAEQTGLIQPLTSWVYGQALQQCRTWKDHGLSVNVAINESMRNLHDPELPERLGRLLMDHLLEPADVTIEITESMIMADPQRALQVVTGLSDMGITLSIDDFGTGYSSLSYLRRLPVDEIKVDKSFVLDMVRDENDATIVRSTIDLAHNLGLTVVAEGVETEAMWEALTTLDCDVAQGYYVAHPMPAPAFERWLSEQLSS
jgi:diguanylate cyclase (GGDEF)-like protein/PAS domain S-box-containing protein